MAQTLPRCQPGRRRLRPVLARRSPPCAAARPDQPQFGQRGAQFVADGQGRRRAPVGVLGWGDPAVVVPVMPVARPRRGDPRKAKIRRVSSRTHVGRAPKSPHRDRGGADPLRRGGAPKSPHRDRGGADPLRGEGPRNHLTEMGGADPLRGGGAPNGIVFGGSLCAINSW